MNLYLICALCAWWTTASIAIPIRESPPKIYIVDATPREITLMWTSFEPIQSYSRASCDNITMINCSYDYNMENTCTVRYIIDQAVSQCILPISQDLYLNLAALRNSSVSISPRYNTYGTLIGLETTFNTIGEPFFFSDGISESPITFYTVEYSNSTLCGSTTIPISSCEGGMCTHTFKVSSSSCSPRHDLNVIVSANATLGSVMASYNPIKIYGVNTFTLAIVDYDDYNTVTVCGFLRFLDKIDGAVEMYTASVYHGANCNHDQNLIAAVNIRKFYTNCIKFQAKTRIGYSEYCLKVTAGNQSTMVIMEETLEQPTFNTSGQIFANAPSYKYLDTITSVIFGTLATFIIMILVLIIIFITLHQLQKWVEVRLHMRPGIENICDTGLLTSTTVKDFPHHQYLLSIQIKKGQLKLLKRKVGKGMFGYVFEATLQNKRCAVKVLHEIGTKLDSNLPILSEDGSVQECRLASFEKEKNFLLKLWHPNIVELIDVFYYPHNNPQTKWPCLVMELLDCSLREYLKGKPKYLPYLIQISLCCDIAKALAYLHENKVIHRDLCGDNILILKRETIPMAKIADFGISRIFDIETISQMTELCHRKGYLPPEGASKNYDLSLDIYMFGVIMVQIIHAIPDIRSPRKRYQLIDKIPSNHPMKQIVYSCVMIEKDDRPNAESVNNDLQKLLRNI